MRVCSDWGVVKKRGVETTHRCILQCLTQLGFEAFSVTTTLLIASCVGSHFPRDVFFASEGKTTSKKTVFLFHCSFFLTTFEFTNRLREKKRAELNQTTLSVDEILLRASGMPRAGGRHQHPGFFLRVFFPRILPQTTSQRPPEVRSWHVHRICKSHIYKIKRTLLWLQLKVSRLRPIFRQIH